MYNYDKEIAFQGITNLLFIINKFKENDKYGSLIINEVLDCQFISLFIMYKTYRNEKVRNLVKELLTTVQSDLLDQKRKIASSISTPNNFKTSTSTIEDEVELIESLKDHICIREDIKQLLHKIFK